jgi:hypothetical protein
MVARNGFIGREGAGAGVQIEEVAFDLLVVLFV